MSVLALDLGGTKLAGAIFNGSGTALARSLERLDGKSGKEAGKLVASQLLGLIDLAKTKRIAVEGVGISIPGIANADGTVWAPNIPGWKRYPLRTEIQRVLRGISTDVPVVIASDRSCCIMGEIWRGNARHCKDVVFMAVGTGIGCGIVSNGKNVDGFSGSAGAIGWMALDRPFQKKYKATGCFEFHASGAGLAKAARDLGQPADAAKVFKAFRQGKPTAKKILANATECWGMAVANVISLLNPEKIILGGGLFGPAVRLIPAIRREASKWAQPVAMKKTQVCASALGPDAGLYGAAYMALQARRTPEK